MLCSSLDCVKRNSRSHDFLVRFTTTFPDERIRRWDLFKQRPGSKSCYLANDLHLTTWSATRFPVSSLSFQDVDDGQCLCLFSGSLSSGKEHWRRGERVTAFFVSSDPHPICFLFFIRNLVHLMWPLTNKLAVSAINSNRIYTVVGTNKCIVDVAERYLDDFSSLVNQKQIVINLKRISLKYCDSG